MSNSKRGELTTSSTFSRGRPDPIRSTTSVSRIDNAGFPCRSPKGRGRIDVVVLRGRHTGVIDDFLYIRIGEDPRLGFPPS